MHIESELLSDKRYLAFRVIDTGTGLSQEQLDKFNKVPPSHFNKENVKEQIGLGLVMVRRIMAEFGGALRISNNKREGGGQGPSGATVELLFRTDREAPPVNSSTGSGAAGSDDGRSKAKPLVKPTESLKGGSGSGGAKKRLSAAGSSSGPVPPPPPAPQPANTKNASQSLPSLPSLAAIMKSRGSNASVGSVGEGGMGFSNPLTNAKVSHRRSA